MGPHMVPHGAHGTRGCLMCAYNAHCTTCTSLPRPGPGQAPCLKSVQQGRGVQARTSACRLCCPDWQPLQHAWLHPPARMLWAGPGPAVTQSQQCCRWCLLLLQAAAPRCCLHQGLAAGQPLLSWAARAGLCCLCSAGPCTPSAAGCPWQQQQQHRQHLLRVVCY
jgi:hypothetical protein